MKYDTLIIGGGHNGLVCAWYLARAGLKVRILEKQPEVGGAAVTEEFFPGFRNSVAAYAVSLLQPTIIHDMALRRHGLELKFRPRENFLPVDDRDYLLLGRDPQYNQEQVARFSPQDARALPGFYRSLNQVADLVRHLLLQTPPNSGGGLTDLLRTLRDLGRLRGLDLEGRRNLLDYLATSAGDLLDRHFDSDPIKALLGFDAIVGTYASPYTPGNGYVLLHHVIGEVNGVRGAWGHAVGGMGSITKAMAAACRAADIEISVESPVQQVCVREGRATGVVLENGDELQAARVVSNLNPRLLYTQMIDADELEPAFLRRIGNWKCASGSLRINVALDTLPDFSCLPGTRPGEHHGAGIIIGPSLDYMDRAYRDAVEYGFSRWPIIEMVIPSTYDDSLAPRGKHVASLFCQQFAPQLPDGRSWDEVAGQAVDTVLETVNEYAPNFRDAVLGHQVLTPLDLERRFGMIGGDIFHGALSLDQLYSARPMLGYADYRGPIDRLYLCGSGAHPGGGVSGAPGYNAAREILRDR